MEAKIKSAHIPKTEQLDWFRERYNHLLAHKFTMCDYVEQAKDKDVGAPLKRLKETQDELIQIDSRRTEVCLRLSS